jgi:hypothetical protein
VHRSRLTFLLAALAPLPSACSGGGGRGAPISGQGLAPQLVYCRQEIGKEDQFSEVRSGTWFGLSERTVSGGAGAELGARISPDNKKVAFVRERRRGDPSSREIYVAWLDSSAPEVRLTSDTFEDDGPCWSPDGTQLLFSTSRVGGRTLWKIAADGSAMRQVTPGPDDRDPDWGATGDVVVFAHVEAATPARSKIMRMFSDGAGITPLTDGGTGPGSGTLVPGDREPSLAPGAQKLLFSRALRDGQRVLMQVASTGGIATPLTDGLGEDRFPRWSKRGDRIFCALSRPLAGRAGLRLAALGIDGSDPALVMPDKRYAFVGFDVLQDVPAWTPATLSEQATIPNDTILLSAGQISGGTKSSLRDKDGSSLMLATETFGSREVAGMRVRTPLPVDEPEDALAVEVEVTAGLSRVGTDSFFRISAYNVVVRRHDTIVEVSPASSDLQTWSFRIQSLAHVDSKRQVELEIVGDLAPGARAELALDQIVVRVRKAQKAQ